VSSLYRHLLRHSLLVSLVPLILLGLWLSWDLERRRHAELFGELWEKTFLARRLLEREPEAGRALLAHLAGRQTGLRLTLIRADGTVIADSHQDPARMENHRNRPEVRQALAAGEGTAERHSTTLNQDMLYVAVALDRGGKRWGVVRGAVPLQRVRAEIIRLRWTLAVAFGLAILGAVTLAARFSRGLAEPLDALSTAARRVEAGRWTQVSRLSGPEEVRELTRDINRMVERLRLLVGETETSRAQLETILAQLEDGLLVLDRDARILRANAAACRLLEIDREIPAGRSLLEAVLSYPLDAVARQALSGASPSPVELRAHRSGRALRALASPLRLEGEPGGAVLLIQDLTEIRRVDQMRRDFVANVSHELKTPIAALRALAETLVLRAERRPEIAVEYARRMTAEVERLGRLVEDLLTLSRIESGKWELNLEALEPEPLLADVARRFEAAAERHGVRLRVEPGEPGGVRADRSALQMALGNVVDNALKYTPRGGEVRLSARTIGDEVVLTVADDGIGISAEDLPRVFERFYRVDRARSRDVEGTGLGLAIVKHLCEHQGGRVWVESERGHGSRFFLALPAAQAPSA
jgi:two-component system, OmpR family, phosphate regulon sensor histidine kinase PhoR